jgi:hypothetical protein
LAIPVMVMNSLRMGCRKMGEIEAQPGYILGKDRSAGAAISYTIIGALRRASDHRSRAGADQPYPACSGGSTYYAGSCGCRSMHGNVRDGDCGSRHAGHHCTSWGTAWGATASALCGSDCGKSR